MRRGRRNALYSGRAVCSLYGVDHEQLDTWCERGILGLVLGILVIGPLALGGVLPLAFLTLQALTLGAVLLWAVRLWLQPRPQLLWPPICWAVLAFAGYAVARYYTADIEYVAREEVVQVLVYTLVFFVVLNNLHRQESIQTITYTLVGLGMLISFYAVYQYLTNSRYVWTFVSTYPHRGSGTYYCPNHLAGFLEMLLPLAAAYVFVSRRKPIPKVMLGYTALVMVAGIGVTLSRGGWLAAGTAMMIFLGILFMRRTLRIPVLILAVLLAGAGGLFVARSSVFKDRLQQALPREEAHSPTQPGEVGDLRFALWHPALKMWEDHPWWGVGPAHFDYRFHNYRPQLVQTRPDRVHNDYLNILVDYGVVGTALMAAIWLLAIVGVVRTWQYVKGGGRDLGNSQSDKFAFVLGAVIGLLAILLHSSVDFNLHIPANAILAVTLLALLSSFLRFATESYWFRARLWVKALVTLVLLAAVVVLGRQGWQRAQEQLVLRKAQKAPVYSPAQIALLKQAFAIDPKNFDTAYNIGESYRVESLDAGTNYVALAKQGMEWYQQAMNLNPYDSYYWLGYGRCLDWLDQHDAAEKYFQHADQLDPNGFFTAAFMGWHYVQAGDLAAAETWLERSWHLEMHKNPIAIAYLKIVRDRLQEEARPRNIPRPITPYVP